MNPLLVQILAWALGELGQFIISFLTNLHNGDSAAQAAAAAATVIVTGIETSTLPYTSVEKRDIATNALAQWHADNSVAVPPIATLNTLVELAVQAMKKSG